MAITSSAKENRETNRIFFNICLFVAYLWIFCAFSACSMEEKHPENADKKTQISNEAKNKIMEQYEILGWSANEAWTGVLKNEKPDFNTRLFDIPIVDIRNCSIAKISMDFAVTGFNRETKYHELWTFNKNDGTTKRLVQKEYILYNAISPSARWVCYTALPINNDGAASLYIYDLETGQSDLLKQEEVSRYCIPVWSANSDRILYQTVDKDIRELILERKEITSLFKGSNPVYSPDNSEIAFQEKGKIGIWNKNSKAVQYIPVKMGWFAGTLKDIMSWSDDGRFLLFGYSSGLLGYQISFATLETKSLKIEKISVSGYLGLMFI